MKPVNLLLCNLGTTDALVETMGVRTKDGPLEVMTQHLLPAGADGQVQVGVGVYVRCGPVPADFTMGHATEAPLIPVESLGRDADESKL